MTYRIVYKCPRCEVKPQCGVALGMHYVRCARCSSYSRFQTSRLALTSWNDWAAAEFARRTVIQKG